MENASNSARVLIPFILVIVSFILIIVNKEPQRPRNSVYSDRGLHRNETLPLTRETFFVGTNKNSEAKECDSQHDQIIQLKNFTLRNSQRDQVFFLETSGRAFLNGRQSCSVDSAAINSGLIPKVILRSPILNLSASYSMCQLYHNYKNVEFYTIDFEDLFKDTPVEGIMSQIEKVVNHGITHLSAVARKALILKYGGFYLDLDVVVLKSLRYLTNFYPLEQYEVEFELNLVYYFSIFFHQMISARVFTSKTIVQ